MQSSEGTAQAAGSVARAAVAGASCVAGGCGWIERAARRVAHAAGGLALALLATGCLGAAEKPEASPAPTPAIWRLQDADSEIWLFGTVHVLPPDLAWRSPAIDAALGRAELVVFETPTNAAAQAEVARVVAEAGMAPAGATLSQRLAPEDAARLARVTKALGVDAKALDGLRPWLAALQLSLRYVARQGHDPDSGVERVLEAEADKRGLPRRYLETPESQIRLLADLPRADEERFLVATLRQIEEDADTIDEMDEAWARGDVDRLGALLTEDIREAGPEVYAALLTRRNAAWTREIDTMMQGKGRIFIAVGAAHLVGADGVPAMLRAKGYTVEGP